MALMYRHGPNKAALIGAGVALFFGGGCVLSLRPAVQNGERPVSLLYFIISLSLLVAGMLVIAAFARYSFTHLWKSTGARHSDKYPNPAEMQKKRKKTARGRIKSS
jgi:hypothetical protein